MKNRPWRAMPSAGSAVPAGLAALAGLCGLPAWAHDVASSPAADGSVGWSAEPVVLVLLALSGLLYGIGFLRLQARSGRGRGHRRAWGAAFMGGWLALAVAFVSPLDALGGRLFSAHMLQHELLMIVAAPLLVLGRPLGCWLWALPRPLRLQVGGWGRGRRLAAAWRWLTLPLTGWVLHAAALWAWHLPALFQAALLRPGVHALQHASFLLTALVFWWTVLGDRAARGDSGVAMLSVFTTMFHTTALGALLTLAPAVWYPLYLEPTAALGFDPLEDQQLGGLVMWVPGGVAYLAGGLAVAMRWLYSRHRRPTHTTAVGDMAGGAAP